MVNDIWANLKLKYRYTEARIKRKRTHPKTHETINTLTQICNL